MPKFHMKICTDCKHLSGSTFCVSPANGISPVTGKPQPMFAVERRSSNALSAFPDRIRCGPDAVHFEPKPPTASWFWRFWKRTTEPTEEK